MIEWVLIYSVIPRNWPLMIHYSPLQRGEVPLYSSLRRFPIIPLTLHRCQHRGGRVKQTNQRSTFMLDAASF